MASYHVETGNYLVQTSGGTAYKQPDQRTVTTVMDHRRTTSRGTVKRTRPLNLLTSQTSHYAQEFTEKRTLCSMDYGNTAPITTYISTSANLSSVSVSMAYAKAEAAQKLRAKILDMQWNAAVSAAEMGKTLTFAASTAKHLLHAYRLAKKGDFLGLSELYRQYDQLGNRRKPAYKRVANVWLQWRYAVRPAVADLNDAMHELARSGVRPVIMRAQGSHTEWVNETLASYNIGTYPAIKRRDGCVKARYVMYYTCSGTASFARLGLTNLPALLWELTPYSFVVDNFIPIGQYLTGLGATVGITCVGGFEVEKHTWGETAMYRGGVSTSFARSYSRTPRASIPNQPSPGLKAPGGDLPSKALDAIALLSQVIRKKREL